MSLDNECIQIKTIVAHDAEIVVYSDGTAIKRYSESEHVIGLAHQLQQARAYLLDEIKRLGHYDWLKVLQYETDSQEQNAFRMDYILDGISIHDAYQSGQFPEIVSQCTEAYEKIGTMWRPDSVRYFLDLDPRNWLYSPSENMVYIIDYLKLDERFI